MRWVLFRSQDGDPDLAKRDEEQVALFLSDADGMVRSLLGLVAKATDRNEPLRLRDLADELGLESSAVRDTIERLNHDVLDEGRDVLQLHGELAVGISGQTGTIAFVSMRPDLVRVVRSAGDSSGA